MVESLKSRHPVELLAPAGDFEAVRAAVANGADAVYFGLANFNARHRAENLEGTSLRETLGFLHHRNVRGYVAFNTLIFSDELEKAVECIREIAGAGADAVIVQDIGILHLIGLMAPALPRHASTQMTLSDARGVEAATRLGVSRVILARELSIADIGKITAETKTPVEVFCHGALCVAYSGQCLTSESIGGRSANRGQCAQACRLPYDLVVDGKRVDQRGRQYLLSPQDLAAVEMIADLMAAGVASVKIEGRLKSGQYVAATTAAYREAIDAAARGERMRLSREQDAQLKQSFSRGFSPGFLAGVNHQQLVQGVFSKKRGIEVGKVVGTTAEGVVVQLAPGQRMKPGDGVVFDEGHPEQDEKGGRVYEVFPARGGVELRFGKGTISRGAISVGSLVWKTDDPAINRQLEQSYSRDVMTHRERLDCRIRAVAGEKLKITFCDGSGRRVEVESEQPVEAARKFPLDEKLAREQMGRLGDTPYELGELRLCGREEPAAADAVMVPKSVLNELRRQGVERLMEMREASRRHEVVRGDALAGLRGQIAGKYPPAAAATAEPKLAVMARTMEQVEAAIAWSQVNPGRMEILWCDFEDIRRYAGAVEAAKSAGVKVGVATMRIARPGEDGFLKLIAEAGADAILVRNLSALTYLQEQDSVAELVGDYSLNIANELTAWVFLEGVGQRGRAVSRLTPSHDLNAAQLEAMLGRISGARFEVVLHQHMPMFHMEHCVFAHMLSAGRDFHDCGRPCEKHRVGLRDRMGIEHPLRADAGCRNTVFNGRAQSAEAYVPRLRELGVGVFRVELLGETAEQTPELLGYYGEVLRGHRAGNRPTTRMKVLNLMGVTPGTLEFE